MRGPEKTRTGQREKTQSEECLPDLCRTKPNQRRLMKIHMFLPSGRVVGIVALKNHLALDCELKQIDLERGDQRAPEYVSLNPNRKIPTLEDDGIVLWESNAILFYMASKRPESGAWPSDLKGQADVLRWLFLEKCALGCRVVRHGRIREGFEGCAWPRPARPGFHCTWGAKLQPLRSGTKRLTEGQDLGGRQSADDRRFFHWRASSHRGADGAAGRTLPGDLPLVRALGLTAC